MGTGRAFVFIFSFSFFLIFFVFLRPHIRAESRTISRVGVIEVREEMHHLLLLTGNRQPTPSFLFSFSLLLLDSLH